MAAGNRPAEAALRANALRIGTARARGAAARGEQPGRRPARVAGARRRLGRVRLAAVGAGRVHAAVARRDGGRPRARAAAWRARARPVRRAGRQDHASGGADGGPRGRRGGRAPSRARGGARAHGRPHGGVLDRGAHRRRRAAAGARGVRPRPGRPALLGPRHARVTARRPLAQAGLACPRGWRTSRARSCAPARTRCGPAARSCTRPARSRPRRTRRSWIASWPTTRTSPPTTSAPPSGRSGSMGGGRMYLQTLPHRDATDGFFIARLRRAGSS